MANPDHLAILERGVGECSFVDWPGASTMTIHIDHLLRILRDLVAVVYRPWGRGVALGGRGRGIRNA